jgi:hypothetical protein
MNQLSYSRKLIVSTRLSSRTDRSSPANIPFEKGVSETSVTDSRTCICRLASLDVRGHAAAAISHLLRFRRTSLSLRWSELPGHMSPSAQPAGSYGHFGASLVRGCALVFGATISRSSPETFLVAIHQGPTRTKP